MGYSRFPVADDTLERQHDEQVGFLEQLSSVDEFCLIYVGESQQGWLRKIKIDRIKAYLAF